MNIKPMKLPPLKKAQKGADFIGGPNRVARRYRKLMLEGNKFPDESDVTGRIFPNKSLDRKAFNPALNPVTQPKGRAKGASKAKKKPSKRRTGSRKSPAAQKKKK
ncbi:MAG: hypothetical protein ABGY96_27425 [bacterium]